MIVEDVLDSTVTTEDVLSRCDGRICFDFAMTVEGVYDSAVNLDVLDFTITADDIHNFAVISDYNLIRFSR